MRVEVTSKEKKKVNCDFISWIELLFSFLILVNLMTSKQPKWMLYGSYGYTGCRILEYCKKKKLFDETKIILGGRDQSKLKKQAETLKLEDYRVFDTKNTTLCDRNLEDISVLFNCAGPFEETTPDFLKHCLKKHIHYLDITGEVSVFEYLHQFDAEAKKEGIILLPGCGMDVVPSDCLAKSLQESFAVKMSDATLPTHLELVFTGGAGYSRGTLKTVLNSLFSGVGGTMIRSNGKLLLAPPEMKTFDAFNDKKFTSVSWGDVSTAFVSTGIPNIKVFVNAPGWPLILFYYLFFWITWIPFLHTILNVIVDKLVDGPSSEKAKLDSSRVHFAGRIWNDKKPDVVLNQTFSVPEGYRFTADSSTEILKTLLLTKNLEGKAGFYTPSLLLGSEFVKHLEDVRQD